MVASIGAVLVTTPGPGVPPVITVRIARGEDGAVQITVVDQAGAPVNLMGMSVAFEVKRYDTDTSPLFPARAATLTDPTHGVCVVYLTPSDTGGLSTGHYRYDVWLTDAGGLRHQIVKASTFVVLEAILSAGDSPSSATPVSPVTNGWVADVAALATVASSQLGPGFVLWVVDSGAGIGSYWHTEVGKGYAIDSSHIAALGLSGGQWVKGLGGSAGAGGVGLVTVHFASNQNAPGGTGEWFSQNTVGEEDVVPDPIYINFDDVTVDQVIARLIVPARVSSGTGTFAVRIGGTLGLPDGAILASGTTTSTSETPVNALASAIAKPSGLQLLQLTLKNGTVGAYAYCKGATLYLKGA